MPASHPMYTPLTASEVKIQKLALAVATVFLAIAVLGFIPGVTTYFDRLAFADWHTGAAIFGVIRVSVVHNLMHMAFAVVGFALARTMWGARRYLIGGGAIYLALNAFVVALDNHGSTNVGAVDSVDNWLRLSLGAAMIILGVFTSRAPDADWHMGAGEGAPEHPVRP